MIKLALECPTKILTEVQERTDFYFTLTHLVLSDPEYTSFYKNRDSSKLLILDNSTNELLTPCSLGDIKRAADILEPDIIVAQDYLGDAYATKMALASAIAVFGKDKVMPVLQGSDYRSVVRCAEAIIRIGFSRIAVPYDTLSKRTDPVSRMSTMRTLVVKSLSGMFPEIHLLGMTTLEELEDYRGDCNVKSVDTGSPVMHGLRGIQFGRDDLLDKSKPTLDLMPEDYSNMDLVNYNIDYLRDILK